MSVLATNKRARFDYEIITTYDSGLVLLGHEVKSIKTGHISLRGSYITIMTDKQKNVSELYLVKANIPLYKYAGTVDDYVADRPRKILLKKGEINHLIGKKQEQGLTLIPLKIYTSHSFVKLELAIAKGKKQYDKRQSIKKRELDVKARSLMKRR